MLSIKHCQFTLYVLRKLHIFDFIRFYYYNLLKINWFFFRFSSVSGTWSILHFFMTTSQIFSLLRVIWLGSSSWLDLTWHVVLTWFVVLICCLRLSYCCLDFSRYLDSSSSLDTLFFLVVLTWFHLTGRLTRRLDLLSWLHLSSWLYSLFWLVVLIWHVVETCLHLTRCFKLSPFTLF